MLRIEKITLETLEEHLPTILLSEVEFPENLRETVDSYREAMSHDRAYCLLLFDREEYVGNATGFGIRGAPYRDLHIDRFRPMDDSVIYLYNIVTLSKYQGKGHGKRLLKEFCEHAASDGFSTLAGHFRDNASLRNFKALGGIEMGPVENWFDTGETYHYCERELWSARVGADPCDPQGRVVGSVVAG